MLTERSFIVICRRIPLSSMMNNPLGNTEVKQVKMRLNNSHHPNHTTQTKATSEYGPSLPKEHRSPLRSALSDQPGAVSWGPQGLLQHALCWARRDVCTWSPQSRPPRLCSGPWIHPVGRWRLAAPWGTQMCCYNFIILLKQKYGWLVSRSMVVAAVDRRGKGKLTSQVDRKRKPNTFLW